MTDHEALALLLATCELDSRSVAFDPQLRTRLRRAVKIIAAKQHPIGFVSPRCPNCGCENLICGKCKSQIQPPF